jgi:hypothetical protein
MRVGSGRSDQFSYRGLLFAGACVPGLVELHGLADVVADLARIANEHPVRQVLAALLTVGLGLCVSGTARAAALSYGKRPPEWARHIEVATTTAAGVIAALVA